MIKNGELQNNKDRSLLLETKQDFKETNTLEFHNRVYGYAQKLVKLLDKRKKSCFKIAKVIQMLFTF